MDAPASRRRRPFAQRGVIALTATDKLIATAEAELGYLEKKTNADLDSKTGNAGSNNYTKYNRDLLKWTGVGYIAAQWCQSFVDWCFIQTFGKDVAKKLLGVFTNYTPTGSDAFKARGRYIRRGKGKPKRGDIIYFYSSSKGRIGHVGIVYKVDGSKVYTIEGNTSGASSLVTNGGGVRKKSYSMSSSYIDGYGSVDYSLAGDTVKTITSEPIELRRGDSGDAVKLMQLKLLGWNPDCLPKYGADGDFGLETQDAVKAFQTVSQLLATGVYDAATRRALELVGAKKVMITKPTVNIRSSPSTASDRNILGIERMGAEFKYIGTTETLERVWYIIEYRDQTAYVSGNMSRLEAGS